MAGANIKIGANSSEFQKQMKEVTTNLKLVSSECGVASEKAKLFGTASDRLAASQKELSSKIQAQNQIIGIYKDRIIGINSEIEKQKTKQTDLSKKIEDTTKKHKESVDATGKNSEESKKLQQELSKLKEDYAKNEKAIDGSNKKLTDTTIKMNNTEKSLLQNQSALEKVNKSVSNIKIDEMAEKFDKAGDKMKSAGSAMTKGVTAPIIGFGAAGIVAFNSVDEAMDTVITKTGATGNAAEGLTDSFEEVAGRVPDDLKAVGEAIGEANTQFGFLGKELEDNSQLMLQFASINGTDVTSSSIAAKQAIEAYGLSNNDLNSVLDAVTKTAQDTGQSVDFLFEKATSGAPQIKSLGLTFAEGTALIGNFEKAGVDSSASLSSLAKAQVLFAKDGKTMTQGLDATIKSILGAKSETEALTVASEVFGTKGASRMVDAIKRGTFNLKDFEKAGENAAGTVKNTFDETVDPIDQAAIASNAAKLAMTKVGEAVQVALLPVMQKVTELLVKLANWFKTLSPEMSNTIVIIAGIAAAIGPGLIALGAMSKGVSNTIKGFRDMKKFGSDAAGVIKKFGSSALNGAKAAGNLALSIGKSTIAFAKNAVQAGITAIKTAALKVAQIAGTIATNAMAMAQAALNFVMSLNPITLIIIAIVALVAIIIILWNKCEWFRNLCYAMFEGLKVAWNSVVEFFKSIWQGFVATWNAAVEGVKIAWNVVCEVFKIVWNAVCEYFKFVWNTWKSAFELVVNGIKFIWESICNAISFTWNIIVESIKSVWNGFKIIFETVVNFISGIWSGITGTMLSVWNGIVGGITSAWDGIIAPFKAVIDSIGRIWEGVKNLFKLPHFTISGTLNPLKWADEGMPKVGVDWYYKGGIFNSPTILGNMGVGDRHNGQGSNAEAVIPLDSMYRNLRNIVREENSSNNEIIEIKNIIMLDGKIIAEETVKKVIKKITKKNKDIKGALGLA